MEQLRKKKKENQSIVTDNLPLRNDLNNQEKNSEKPDDHHPII